MNSYISGYRWYGYGYEYKSATKIAGWPLLHICAGIDPLTLRPGVARGIIAIGDLAVGVLAIGGFAVGSIAIGGVAAAFIQAVGGVEFGMRNFVFGIRVLD